MRRILTLALLASAMSLPAFAEDNASRGAGVGVGVGADVGIGAQSDTSIDTDLDTDMDRTGNAQFDSGADADINADADVNAEADMNSNTGVTGRTATGDTSVGGAAQSTASSSQSIRGENLARNDIVLIQQALRQEGLYEGSADGIWGPRTASALMQFQQRNQLGATGTLNSNTLDQLGVELGSSGSASGSVSGSASSGANSNNRSTIDNSQGVGSEATPGSTGTY